MKPQRLLPNRTSSMPHRKQCHRYNEPGHAHFLTFSCFRRSAFLSKDRSREWFLQSFRAALTQHDFSCWAYVVMPEHVHLLVHPRQTNYDISKLLASTKLPVTLAAVSYLKRYRPDGLAAMEDRRPNGPIAYRFWQRGGGMDINLWSPEKIWQKIDYIHANPSSGNYASAARIGLGQVIAISPVSARAAFLLIDYFAQG